MRFYLALCARCQMRKWLALHLHVLHTRTLRHFLTTAQPAPSLYKSPETDRLATETAEEMHPKTVMKNGKTAFHDGLTS
jgi:hypothetical protein